MNLFQIVLSLYFAFVGAYLSIALGRLLRQNGNAIRKIDEGLRKMDEGFRKMDEGFQKMDERAEQRHREVIELLKKGFGGSAS